MNQFGDVTPRILNPPSLVEPKREIHLDPETEELVELSINTLNQSGFEVADIFDIFHDWKSRQTKAARRVLISLSVLIGGTYWIGIDLSQASIWGLSLGDASLIRFLLLASAILLSSAILYLISRSLDSRVRSAKITRTTKVIGSCRKAARSLEQVVAKNRLKSVDDLIDDFSEPFQVHHPDAQDSYDAVRFYENELERAYTVRKWIDVAELVSVLAVGLYASYAVVMLAWSGTA